MAAPLLTAIALASSLAWGRSPIREVRLDAAGAESVARLRAIFGVKAGDIASLLQIRRGVQALMASERAEDVTVDAVEGPDGVALHVVIQVASRVGELEVGGLPRRDRKLVLRELDLREGDRLRVGQFEKALGRAEERVRQDGYPGAVLDPDLDFDVGRGTVKVVITGRLGAPLTAGKLELSGFDLAPAELWKVTALSVGRRLTAGALEGARRRLAEYARRRGWWETVVDEPQVEGTASHATVRFTVRPGPQYQLELNGLKLSRSLKSEALPFLSGEEPFSETALDSTIASVRQYLQRQGRMLARVSGKMVDDKGQRVLELDVGPGARTPIVAVRFPGAAAIPADQLRSKVGVHPGRPWWWGGEPVDDATLQADVDSLLTTFREAGFADAEVGPARVVPEGDGVAVEYPIVEGRRRLLTALTINGVPEGIALPTLGLREGGPWSLAAEAQARDTVQTALQDAGYPDARVLASDRCGAHAGLEGGQTGRSGDGEAAGERSGGAGGVECTVEIDATPGAKVRVDQVVYAGLVRTDRSVVEKVGGLRPGPWIGPDEQLAAQRRLLALGIFRSAALRTIPGQSYGPERGMVLNLSEAATRVVAFGIGWNTEDHLRVSGSWSELNLFGKARSLSLDATLSSRVKRYQIAYREPARLGVFGFPTAVAVYRSDEIVAEYNFLRRGMWVELGNRQRRPDRLLLRYDYEIVHSDAPEDIKSQLERDQQDIAIASITPVLERDSRDDVFDPHRGIFASLQLQSAFKAFIADVQFEKLMASLSAYHPLGSGVLAAVLRGGAIQPRGSVPAGQAVCVTDNCLIPVPERFFAGGRVSQRAFRTDLLGVPGETVQCEDGGSPIDDLGCKVVAVGGGGLLLTSLEWRVPVWGVVGASVFVDGGNVWPSWHDVAVGQMRWGAGLGLRVVTPVGPFRLEYGWKLHRRPWESPGELYLSFGNPF